MVTNYHRGPRSEVERLGYVVTITAVLAALQARLLTAYRTYDFGRRFGQGATQSIFRLVFLLQGRRFVTDTVSRISGW